MSLKEKLAKSDVKIFAFAAVGIGLCAYFLFFDSGINFGSNDDATELGQVTYFLNDARQKGTGSYVWQNVKSDQKVFLGDSIYSGEKSRVQVILNNGSDVNIGENSLVTFGQLENQKVLDLRLGEVNLKVDGTLKLAVKGKVTTFTGTKSEVRVEVQDKISRVKLVQGEAQVSHKDLPEVKLELEKEMVLPEPEVPVHVTANDLPPLPSLPAGVEPVAPVGPPVDPATAAAVDPTAPVDPTLDPSKMEPTQQAGAPLPTENISAPDAGAPVTSENLPPVEANLPPVEANLPQIEANIPPVAEVSPAPVEPPASVEPQAPSVPSALSGESFSYVWKLHDLFTQDGESIAERRPRPTLVPVEYPVSWKSNHRGTHRIQISNGPIFDDSKHVKMFEADSNETVLGKAYLGKTYWRVSKDGKNWSDPESVNVMVRTLKGADPRFDEPSIRLPLLGKAVSVNMPLQADVNAYGYVVQSSTDPQFAPGKTKTQWAQKPELSYTFASPIVQYYRFRVVNEKQEISDWSQSAKVVVFAPVPPLAPKITEDKKQVQTVVGEPIDLKFKSAAATTWLEVYDENDKKVQTEKGTELKFTPKEPGRYKARAFSVNDYGQVGPSSDLVQIDVNPNLNENVDRSTASVDSSSSAKIEEIDNTPPKNTKYNSGRMTAQGMVWALQSTEQKINQTGTPITTGVSVNGLHWWDKHGFEGSYKTGVKAVTSAGQESESIQDIEARYHYRFMGRFPWSQKEIEMSYIFGYENFHNSAANASNHYDIVKLGMSFKFPMLKNWAGGGEILLGRGFENSTKYEISGYFNYFYDPAWSVGAGYRLHLFEAGSTKSTPTGILPYREGYSEGFSGLNYHF